MVSVGNPKTWVPYMETKDCSQGFCSLYCPQWCYIIFPPPPPFKFHDESSSTSFSPLVIAIIGILASAFLLVSYYTMISKYCGKMESSRENHDPDRVSEENHNASLHEPWHATMAGLDEALVKSITVCKYKKGDGLIEGTDCSVCLSEFQDNESLRLLPKCSHAFHIQCIDMWLRSHSNCPLCRAHIIFINATAVSETLTSSESSGENLTVDENATVVQDIETDIRLNGEPALRAFSNLGNSEGRDVVIDIRGDELQHIRRSVSMSYACQSQVSVADILRVKQNEDQESEFQVDAGSSKDSSGEVERCNNKNRVLHCVATSPMTMKRSFSSGRYSFNRQGRLQKSIARSSLFKEEDQVVL